MPRSWNASATLVAIAVAAAGCGITGVLGLGGGTPSPTATAKPTAPVPDGPRERPRHPVLLSLGEHLPRTQDVVLSGGTIEFDQKPVRYQLGFVITPWAKNDTGLHVATRGFAKAGARPQPYAAGAARGHVAEFRGSDPLYSGDAPRLASLGEGTYRIYAVSRPRSEITVFLTVFAPEGTALTAAHRARADLLMRSVVTDEASAAPGRRGPRIQPVAPFTYVRPKGLTGGKKIDDVGGVTLWLGYSKDGALHKRVSLSLRQLDPFNAPGIYRINRGRAKAAAGGGFHDIKRMPGVRVPEWIDEGHLVTQRAPGREPADVYTFRGNWWEIRVDSPSPGNRQAMRDLIESLRPGAYGYIT